MLWTCIWSIYIYIYSVYHGINHKSKSMSMGCTHFKIQRFIIIFPIIYIYICTPLYTHFVYTYIRVSYCVYIYIWLVVLTILKNMKVKWEDDYSHIYIWKNNPNVPNHQPVYIYTHFSTMFCWLIPTTLHEFSKFAMAPVESCPTAASPSCRATGSARSSAAVSAPCEGSWQKNWRCAKTHLISVDVKSLWKVSQVILELSYIIYIYIISI